MSKSLGVLPGCVRGRSVSVSPARAGSHGWRDLACVRMATCRRPPPTKGALGADLHSLRGARAGEFAPNSVVSSSVTSGSTLAGACEDPDRTLWAGDWSVPGETRGL